MSLFKIKMQSWHPLCQICYVVNRQPQADSQIFTGIEPPAVLELKSLHFIYCKRIFEYHCPMILQNIAYISVIFFCSSPPLLLCDMAKHNLHITLYDCSTDGSPALCQHKHRSLAV